MAFLHGVKFCNSKLRTIGDSSPPPKLFFLPQALGFQSIWPAPKILILNKIPIFRQTPFPLFVFFVSNIFALFL